MNIGLKTYLTAIWGKWTLFKCGYVTVNLLIMLKYIDFWYAQEITKYAHSIFEGVSMGTSKAPAVLRKE